VVDGGPAIEDFFGKVTGVVKEFGAWYDQNQDFINQDLPRYINLIADSVRNVGTAINWGLDQ